MWSSASEPCCCLRSPVGFVRQIRLLHSVVPPWKKISPCVNLFLFHRPISRGLVMSPDTIDSLINLTSQGSIDTPMLHYSTLTFQIRCKIGMMYSARRPVCLSTGRLLCSVPSCAFFCCLCFSTLPYPALPLFSPHID
jgi:hypothetical protein